MYFYVTIMFRSFLGLLHNADPVRAVLYSCAANKFPRMESFRELSMPIIGRASVYFAYRARHPGVVVSDLASLPAACGGGVPAFISLESSVHHGSFR